MTSDTENSWTLMVRLAAQIARELIGEGYSVLFIGPSGIGKSSALELLDDGARDYASAWNDLSASRPPKSKNVAYVLMGQPLQVGLHFKLPSDWEEIMRRHGGVHRHWFARQ